MIEISDDWQPNGVSIPPGHPLGYAAMSPGVTGTVDDDDEPEDESDGENEAPIRETDEFTEAPEEFETDDEDDLEDDLGHPEDDN